MPPVFRSLAAPLIATVCLIAACDDNADLQEPPAPTVAQVTVTAAESALVIGDSVQLTAAAVDSAGNPTADQIYTWATSNPAVAAVSDAGMVAAVTEGEATITATTAGVTGSLVIAVVPSEAPAARASAATRGHSGPRADRHRPGVPRLPDITSGRQPAVRGGTGRHHPDHRERRGAPDALSRHFRQGLDPA